MKVTYLCEESIFEDTVLAVGFFDGLHLAHQHLINETIEIGKKLGKKTALLTFDVHPKTILFDLDYQYITPLQAKIKKLKQFDLDDLYILRFTKRLASMDPKEFIETYLKNAHTIVCGFDFKFGVRGSGNVDMLRKSKYFQTIVVDEITYHGYKVGSTHIRDLLHAGRVDEVEEILGHPYEITGRVVHGAKKGRMIGYPTANIDTTDYLIPRKGVYATKTLVEDVWYPSMSSIGHNPTLNCRSELSVESNIFEFDQEIYGKEITTVFIKRLRDEIKFEEVNQLIKQIDQDKIDTIEILKNHL
ncbi:MAG: bifunctional riboflavin kinase/FAD synthetase [Candidatus Izemoplasmataceae bacterium]